MSIPKPLVQLNQTFIVVTVLMGIFINDLILFFPFFIGAYTLQTRQNPVILFGKRFLKKPLDRYTPKDHEQQLFNQWIATICLGLSIIFFFTGWSELLGYVFSIMVVASASMALTGFCIGCVIRYRYMMWKHKRVHS
ncbi:DUF4395 domain-containing protein [Halobacillus seohaensis]|uniref:DUF4395 domain-containing protein n=1 Tax=Halobacillus seohaensis TaxID=447421 RepID=A0ABW2ETE4_9BACI